MPSKRSSACVAVALAAVIFPAHAFVASPQSFSASRFPPSLAIATRDSRVRSGFHTALHASSTSPIAAPSPSLVGQRFKSSVQVTFSKIFPAGAGWQTASVVAANSGFATTSWAFFASVGLGDLLGVMIGHMFFQILRKVVGKDVSLRTEIQTASLLGSAAFFSGFTWQIALNVVQAVGLGFTASLVSVGAACALAFFAGLRVFRKVLSQFMSSVEYSNYANLKADAGLSCAIGGATAFFVGTDASYGPANWLIGLVGITDAVPLLLSIVLAGISTSLGFMTTQLVQMLSLPQGKCWVDPPTPKTAEVSA